MSYTVIARRWRPQRLEEVVGQRAVTRTLHNAIASGRIAQAFVFAGPRGVGKTTTARILARMLNCEKGPTPDPCGACDACREIADGRDMDVLEIDAASNTGIDNVREVIISGLAILPARDRYKVFIIDEVHQLSTSSFNALLKSIEEPPPHVAFIMATTAPEKIPETIVSRAQVFEFKTIASRAIADQLARIVAADGIDASPEAIALIARAAEGSMRDAQTALDQVIAFAGGKVTAEDVSALLGLVGRDLLFEVMAAVADENGAAAFELAGRAVESGYDLRMLCRELSRLVRDLLVLSVDPSRFGDPEVAPETDRSRLEALLPRFSREDLLRAFDVLARAEDEVRRAAEPRTAFEMALLRWIHLRRLTPLADLIDRLERGGGPPAGSGGRSSESSLPFGGQVRPAAPSASASSAPGARRQAAAPLRQAPPARQGGPAAAVSRPPAAPTGRASDAGRWPANDPDEGLDAGLDSRPAPRSPAAPPSGGPALKDAFVAGIQKGRPMIFQTVVTEAQRIDVEGSRIVFRYASNQTMLADQVAQQRQWLESLASEVAGRRMSVAAEVAASGPAGPARRNAPAAAAASPAAPKPDERGLEPEAGAPRDLRAEALRDPAIQSLLDVIPAELRDVTELKDP
ncbi:MAG TPA: DNA polymerase III subunit gamma/tau [Vicinamibacterales bacterium]|nr:DNA polymerase III subunit gamma/tau [Vicinamibacterales bacterium]HPK71264.1 DNA polymerase III subunit gamma/tau [Vicinamibacterales bacterium]